MGRILLVEDHEEPDDEAANALIPLGSKDGNANEKPERA
jgi:hypothetical protein